MKSNRFIVYMVTVAIIFLTSGCEDSCESDSDCTGENNEHYKYYCSADNVCESKCKPGSYRNENNECVFVTEDMVFTPLICDPLEDENCKTICDLSENPNCKTPCEGDYVYPFINMPDAQEWERKCVHNGCLLVLDKENMPLKEEGIYEYNGICLADIAFDITDQKSDGIYKFPNLKYIIGKLSINSDNVKQIELPALEEVATIDLYVPVFESIEFPALIKVSDLQISSSSLHPSNLKTIGFPELKSINTIDINNIAIESLEFPALETAKSINLWKLPVLKQLTLSNIKNAPDVFLKISTTGLSEISLPNTEIMRGISIQNCSSLQTLDLPALKQLSEDSEDGWLLEKGMMIWHNPQLTEINIPKVESTQILSISNNDALEYIEFPMLKSISKQLTITDNPTLKEIHMPTLESVGTLEYENNPSVTVKEWKIDG